jgi:hypothetical protein
MAKVIIGGQMLSLVLALVVTPVFYSMLDTFVSWTRRLGIRFTVEPRVKAPTAHWPHAQTGHNGSPITMGSDGAGDGRDRAPSTHPILSDFAQPD